MSVENFGHSNQSNRVSAQDACPICGWRGEFADQGGGRRDVQNCRSCRSSLRYRNQAASILTHAAMGRYATMRDMVRDISIRQSLSVYEIGLKGPFIKYFNDLENYTRSYLWSNVQKGEMHDGVRCEDLTELTMSSCKFDLVVSSDVMEHVIQFEQAFKEIHRVLRPGGCHVFTVPIDWPMPTETVLRATEKAGCIVHHKEPRFHTAGDGTPTLVCTDFGFDLIKMLKDLGYDAWFERPSIMRVPGYFDTVVVSKKKY